MSLFYALFLTLILTGCGHIFQGKPGVDGGPGQSCTVNKVDTVTYIKCPDGSEAEIPDGEMGPTGPRGDTGATGATGATGSPGQDSTPITVIQLCPALGPPVYPTTFPEVAWCLSNTLYGVYDQDGTHVFLSALPAGQYISTGPQSCTFTVGANCVVSN